MHIITTLVFIIPLMIEPIYKQQSNEIIPSAESAGHWQTLNYNGEPSARHENAFVEVNGKFYLLGGRGIKSVDIFDPETRNWTKGTKPPIELHHFQGVVYDQKIYIIGAMTGKFPNETPVENIIIYDPAQDQWETGVEIPAARRRGSAGVVVKGNKAIVISGIINGHVGGHVPWVDQYNFDTREWNTLVDAPRARDHFHAAEYQGKIYCAGGRNTDHASAKVFALTIPEVDVYDINSNRWTTLPQSNDIPTRRAGTAATVLGDELIIMGGESGSQSTAHDEVEAYNITSQSWRSLSNLERGRHGTQAVRYNNKIYIMAGSGNRGGSPELNSIEMFHF